MFHCSDKIYGVVPLSYGNDTTRKLLNGSHILWGLEMKAMELVYLDILEPYLQNKNIEIEQ